MQKTAFQQRRRQNKIETIEGKNFFCYIVILWPYMRLPPHEATWFWKICCKSLDPNEEAVSYVWLCNFSILNFLIYEEILIFFLLVYLDYLPHYVEPLPEAAHSLLRAVAGAWVHRVLKKVKFLLITQVLDFDFSERNYFHLVWFQYE